MVVMQGDSCLQVFNTLRLYFTSYCSAWLKSECRCLLLVDFSIRVFRFAINSFLTACKPQKPSRSIPGYSACRLMDIHILQEDLNAIVLWAKKWQMNLNPSKHELCHIHFVRDISLLAALNTCQFLNSHKYNTYLCNNVQQSQSCISKLSIDYD